ncbi:MAG TPA: peptide-methionine (R)-S-oxide reductase, partial [Kofleriaceae bacterium]|nr:peptide-methionine (R)-S-oxide reductase [Kofleriaceae bacterium]
MTTSRTSTSPRPGTSASGFDLTPLSSDRIAALAAAFTPEERHIILHQGTERPFCGLLLDQKQPGTYTCRLCGLPLFRSDAKFESGTGWPSFFQPFDRDHITEITDDSH